MMEAPYDPPIGRCSPGIAIALALALALAAVGFVLARRLVPRPAVRLLDMAVFKPPESWRVPRHRFLEMSEACGAFTPEALAFQRKIATTSGLGAQETFLPPGLLRIPPDRTMAAARAEFEQVCFGTAEEALRRAGVTATEVGVVVVNCSLFCPTPCLSATLMAHFKMRPSTINYNLGGMGCSAGLIALDLAADLLRCRPNTVALVVSTENVTQNWYFGNHRPMLIANALFRSGGAAVVLSNRPRDARRAKYDLRRIVRTNLSHQPDAFGCVYEHEDEVGIRGVALSKTLMEVAARALRANLTQLGPHILPFGELVRFAAACAARAAHAAGLPSAALRALRGALPAGMVQVGEGGSVRVLPYTPKFDRAFDHVCIHSGGRGVLDAIERSLSLPADAMDASRATLFRFGNVSSASVWYELAFAESSGAGVARGARVWQLGFGSGFACNSAVWVARRDIRDAHAAWEGIDMHAVRAELASVANAATAAAAPVAAAPAGAEAAAVAVPPVCAAAARRGAIAVTDDEQEGGVAEAAEEQLSPAAAERKLPPGSCDAAGELQLPTATVVVRRLTSDAALVHGGAASKAAAAACEGDCWRKAATTPGVVQRRRFTVHGGAWP